MIVYSSIENFKMFTNKIFTGDEKVQHENFC